MSAIQLNGIVKRYGTQQVIHGIDLSIEDREFCVFVGPSGCGKSTLLRIIAGLEEIDAGTITIGERDITYADPSDRGIAMVFQSYALYPHMSVAENMGFGLKMNGMEKNETARRVAEAAHILQLEPYLERKPAALSGGQRQRVAIGRAITRGPEVFLFDEPLSNLDAEMRVDMRVEIARLHKALNVTMAYVTHDQVEAMTLADKIVVLRDGRIEQTGSPMELYKYPDNMFVAGFIGSPSMNFVQAKVTSGKLYIPAFDKMVVDFHSTALEDDRMVIVGIRPRDLKISAGNSPIRIELQEQLGGTSYCHLRTSGGEKLVAETDNSNSLTEDLGVWVDFDVENMHFFDNETKKRICDYTPCT